MQTQAKQYVWRWWLLYIQLKTFFFGRFISVHLVCVCAWMPVRLFVHSLVCVCMCFFFFVCVCMCVDVCVCVCSRIENLLKNSQLPTKHKTSQLHRCTDIHSTESECKECSPLVSPPQPYPFLDMYAVRCTVVKKKQARSASKVN